MNFWVDNMIVDIDVVLDCGDFVLKIVMGDMLLVNLYFDYVFFDEEEVVMD